MPKSRWDTFLVLASEREQFFEKKLDIGKAFAGSAAARVYGSIKVELVLDGKHLVVCQRCVEGEDVTFLRAMHEAIGCF